MSQVLASRVGILPLPSITYFEERGARGMPLWAYLLQESRVDQTVIQKTRMEEFHWIRILTGGFPLSLTAQNESQRVLWTESFRSMYLKRDLGRISDISHLAEFARLMEMSALRTAQVLNQAQLARDAAHLSDRLRSHHQPPSEDLLHKAEVFAESFASTQNFTIIQMRCARG